MSKTTMKVHCDKDRQNCAVSNTAGNHDGNTLERTIDPRMKEAQEHYQYMSEHLENELKMYEDKLHNIQLTNKALKQNLIDMDKEKQRIIVEFHEHYRKLSINVKLVNQIEEDLERLKGFLENARELVNDVLTSKDEGVNHRKYILAAYQKSFEELKKIELSYTERLERSQKFVDDILREAKRQQICNETNEELKTYLKICREKRNKMDELLQITLDSCNKIETEIINVQNITETDANKAHKKFSNLTRQMNLETQALINSVHQLKEGIAAEFAVKQKLIDEFKAKISLQILSMTELSQETADSNNQIEILEREVEQKRNKCAEMGLKIRSLIEQEKENRLMKTNKKMTDIQNLHSMIETKTKDLQSLREEIEKRITEKETLASERDKLQSTIDLQKKISDAADLATSLTQRNENLKKDIPNLKKLKQDAEMRIHSMENHVQQKKLRIAELEGNLKTSNVDAQEKSEEQKILDNLLQLRGEQNSINERVNAELDYLYTQISETLRKYTDSQIELEQIQLENTKLDDKIQEKRKSLEEIMMNTEVCKDSIQVLKKNVKEGRATTQQELNKKYNMMVNAKNMEKEKCDKVKNEIKKIKHRISQMNMKTDDDQRFDIVKDNTTTTTRLKRADNHMNKNQK